MTSGQIVGEDGRSVPLTQTAAGRPQSHIELVMSVNWLDTVRLTRADRNNIDNDDSAEATVEFAVHRPPHTHTHTRTLTDIRSPTGTRYTAIAVESQRTPAARG